ncbi:MAG: glycine/sarcosine/betaine reductase selenoprotein B family protein [Ktedonobacterales bacterium]
MSTAPNNQVDSYRFLDGLTKRMVKTWVSLAKPTDIPWTALTKPLHDCTVSMISSGGFALKSDLPFDQDIERRDPWFSDPSFRIIPRGTTTADIKVYHLHFNPAFAERDLGCIFPLQQLAELETCGEIGHSAPSHYSYMGYTLRPARLLNESVPAIIKQLQQEKVDVVLLIPV